MSECTNKTVKLNKLEVFFCPLYLITAEGNKQTKNITTNSD